MSRGPAFIKFREMLDLRRPHPGQISNTMGQTWFPAYLRHKYIFDPADQHFL